MSSNYKRGISSVAIRKIVPILLVLTIILSGSIIVIDRFDLFNSATSLHSNSGNLTSDDPSHGYVSSDVLVNNEPTVIN